MLKSSVPVVSVVLLGVVLALAAPALAIDVVVGNGTPASCTEAALNTAVTQVVPVGGNIQFNCGGPATIPITSQKIFYFPSNPTLFYGIDGGGVITLAGNGATRHIFHLSGSLAVANITLTGGRAVGADDNASGAAIRSDRNPSQVPPAIGLTLNNVTFTNNATSLTGWVPPFSPFDYGGAAVFTRLAYLAVINCRFVGNTANNSAGGAIHGRSSSITISGTEFTNNVSTGGGFGGAIHIDGMSLGGANGAVQISTSTFTGNTALQQGGAIFFFAHNGLNETLTIDTVSFTNNRVVDSGNIPFVGTRGWGGAISGNYASVAIRNSTFSGNSARGQISANGGGFGGAIALTQATGVSIVNTTVSGNQTLGSASDSQGGGVLIAGNTQPFQIVHSTIAQNSAAGQGGGVFGLSGTIANSIISSNSAPSAPQCAVQLGNGGTSIQFPDSSPRCASGILVANPLLGALANNGGFTPTHLPQGGSPAVNAVPCAVNVDQRGVARPQGPQCDMGSVEVSCSLTMTPRTLPTGRVGVPYTQAFTASGGAATFSLSGPLPAGLSFSNGTLSGTPSQSGAFLVTVTATGSCSTNRAYNLVIANNVSNNPVALVVADPGNNQVLDPNEGVILDPFWLNTTGAPVNLTGTLSSFIGPAGATYAITDGSAAYGTIPNGASGHCGPTGNCYSVGITAGVRPEQHWDASVVESVSAGGPKAWTLHVGGSFTDVPAANGFYRFVETLLHRGVTGGCSGTLYCPGTVTTRDSMAVFVLVSKEGAGYLPPACSGAPMFPDVPTNSPFCRWIEELAARGVVGGCGGGNYCPTNPVSREQMAVFVLLTLDPNMNPPACSPPNTFLDVPESSVYCRYIEELARRGVVSGCGGGNYCPTTPVTRDQMAVFLTGTFGLTLYGP